MKQTLGKISLMVVFAFALGTVCASMAEAQSEVYKSWRGLALKGYDPVAYHQLGKPVEGSGEFELTWKDATWRFASKEHLELFRADPDRYAPRYGGYCAWAVSQGYTASVDPVNAWSLVDGKLYLNYSADVKATWENDIPGNIRKADANWPGVLD